MTISSQQGRQAYAGDGVSTVFTVPFKFFQNSDLTVILQSASGVDTTLTENVHYTVTGAGSDSGGTVTMATAPAIGETLSILLDPELTQPADYISNDVFPAETHERALDRLTQQNIRTRDIVNRALRLPDGDASVMPTLPGAATRAGKFLRFDNNGDPEMATGIDQSQTLSQSVIGQFLYPQTLAEVAAGVMPVNYAYPPGHILRYGTNTTPGTTDMTSALSHAIATGHDVYLPPGTYAIDGGSITMSTVGQRLTGGGRGNTFIRKASNGNLLTITANYVQVEDLDVSNDLSSTYTGYNIYVSGTTSGVKLLNISSHRSLTNCIVIEQGGHWTIDGCYVTNTDAPSGTPAIVVGKAGTTTFANLYGEIGNCQIQPNGVQFLNCGGCKISGSQVGGVMLTTDGGQNSVNAFIGNRITGDVSVEGSGQCFIGNALGAHTFTWETGSGQNVWIGVRDTAGSTYVNNGNDSNLFIESDVSSGYLTWHNPVHIQHGKGVRFYNAAGDNYATLLMSTNNMALANNAAGSLQLAAAAGQTVQLIVGGAQQLRVDDNSTAGNTRLLIYDVDNGQLERVSVGAADSGGVGFKVLRIPN
jgi:hypothetical protein